jgi:tRNA (mo5U34)-methyltransferase
MASLPVTPQAANLDSLVPSLGQPVGNPEALRQNLMAFHPWRKGPWRIGGIEIDTEWRSDWKWQRVAPHVNLKGQRVLDIGSGNGYFGMQMLEAGAQFVAGIDPTLVFVMQWLACRHFSGDLPNYVLPLGIEELPDTPGVTDCVFSMGVLYHRKSPAEHLEQIYSLLAAGGTMVLETLVLPRGSEEDLLVPGERYARMRNVWAIPGTSRLKEWVNVAGFSSAEVVDITPTTPLEQRSTDWMQFESLQQALDPSDCLRTVEGFPAPIRAIVVARK